MSYGSRLFHSLCTLPVLAALVVCGAAAANPGAPVAVSPGSLETFARIDQHCPTFSWGAATGVRAWEIAVYVVRDAAAMGDGRAERVVSRTLPESATSWTASGADCLADGRYAWLIRSVAGGETGEWSQARLFQVSTPTAGVARELRELIERYFSSRSDEAPAPVGDAPESELPEVSPSEAARSEAGGGGLGSADFSIDSAGSVVGSSFTGDGSGLTGVDAASLEGEVGDFYRSWGNLTGVPGGFADGIDDNSDTLALLPCTNGQIAKKAGSEWACGGDADTVAQLGCGADEVPQYTGAAWTCTPLTVDNVGAAIPGAPTRLRIGPEHRLPGMRRLAWNMSSLAGVASFVVYQADSPITDGNKASARRRVATSLYAAVDLYPNSGLQHFRVEAQNVLGETGPLSVELTIDTTSRLAYAADYDAPFEWNLYTVPAVPGGARTLVNDPFLEYYSFAWSPDGARLGYSSNQPTYSGLHVAAVTGGTPTRVDDPSAGSLWGFSWSWSPDGTQLAYRADPPGPEVSWQLWVVPAGGGSAVRVNDAATTLVAEIPRPAWSPDGTRLLYGGWSAPGPVALYSAPATGGGQTELSGPFPVDAAGVLRASWSPDGSKVAYLADQETTDDFELWVVPASGGPPLRVNPPVDPGGSVSRFAWSPDGTRLAYVADLEGDTVAELFVAAASGGPSTKLNEPLVGGGDVFLLEWSPDGRQIAYTADLTIDGRTELRVVAAAGGAGLRVSPTNSRGEPYNVSGGPRYWSPDGRHLAFAAVDSAGPGNDGAELYVTTPDGLDRRTLNNTLVTGGGVRAFAWSPDSSRLVYLADQDTAGQEELYLVGLNGGGATRVNDPLAADRMGVTGFSWSPLGN